MMKRQKRYNVLENNDDHYLLQKINQPKFDYSIEAQVQDGETLQALALRFHCTVTEIKRLNKIDKDNEIYARKTIKVPMTPHSVLLETLPTVHKSGQSSPKHTENGESITKDSIKNEQLGEKLLVASVNASEIHRIYQTDSINTIILNSKIKPNYFSDDHDDENLLPSNSDPFICDEIDESIPQPRVVPVPTKSAFDWSGSDCDISWICLLICILALCFAIPLVYVIYVAEHPEKFNQKHK